MSRGVLRAAIALSAALAALAGCSGDTARPDAPKAAPLSAAEQAAAEAQAQAASAAAVQELLRLTPGPLIYASQDGAPAPMVLGMIGENGTLRTYATSDMRAVMLRSGVLVGTRGLGNDVSSSDAEALIAALRAPEAPKAQVAYARTIRFLDGLGTERPLPLDCALRVAKPREPYAVAGQQGVARAMAETCTGRGYEIANSYVVAKDGTVIASRQWVSPALGYLGLQVLRP